MLASPSWRRTAIRERPNVGQEAQLAFDEALSALARMRELENDMQSASGEALDQLFQEYERLTLHFEVAGGFDVEHRTDEVLMGLGFGSEQMDEPVRTLSGGQKTRIALAKALLADPISCSWTNPRIISISEC